VKSIKKSRQLFIDDQMIERLENVALTMNPPQKKGPVIMQDRPWRSKLTGYFGSVLEDGGTYKMWANCGEGDVGNIARNGISYGKNRYVQYLESKDGLHWESPSLGVIEFKGSRNNNLVLSEDCLEGSVFIDPNAPAAEKFKYFHYRYGIGLVMFTSADGIHWQDHGECLLRHTFDSQNVAFWDSRLRKYVCYLRGWESAKKNELTNDVPSYPVNRNVVRIEVDDFQELGRFQGEIPVDKPTAFFLDRLPAVLRCDEKDPVDTDIYTNAVVKYPLADDVYLAFPALYSKFKPAAENRNDGILGVQMAVSRDGIAWNRIRKPYLPTGAVGEIDSASAYMHTGMIIRETEIYQYYWGASYTHGGRDTYSKWQGVNMNAVFAVSQRIDGFVSADAEYEGGELLTKLFTFEGNRLIVNIDTTAIGQAVIALVDHEGREIEGFASEDCDRIKGNFIRKAVSWNGNEDVSRFQGQAVRLRFDMRGTKLFSFYFE
jgi:hypothetical protein